MPHIYIYFLPQEKVEEGASRARSTQMEILIKKLFISKL